MKRKFYGTPLLEIWAAEVADILMASKIEYVASGIGNDDNCLRWEDFN